MRINNVSTGYADATLRGRNNDVMGAVSGRSVATSEIGSTGGNPQAVAQIIAQYDVTAISPAEFSEMIQQLHQAGVISDGDLEELSAVRAELEAAGIEADDRIDLRQFYTERKRLLEEQLGEAGDAGEAQRSRVLGPTTRKLDWIEKLALLHAQPELSFDAAA